jgi:hypothetical protein
VRGPDDSLGYVEANFLSLEQLEAESGVSGREILALIDGGCLPGHAYEVIVSCSISSVFGDHSQEPRATRYYPRAHVGLVAEACSLSREVGRGEAARRLKERFAAKYLERLGQLEAHRFGFEGCFDGGRVTGEGIRLAEEEYDSFLDGTYGVCTKNATPEEIAEKAVMVRKIELLTDDGARTDLGEEARTELARAVRALDRVSAPFAPHERPASSRYRCVERIAAKYDLHHVEEAPIP